MWRHCISILSQVTSCFELEWRQIKKGVRWAQDKRKGSHAQSKNAVWCAFYCVQVRVHKKGGACKSSRTLRLERIRIDCQQVSTSSSDHRGYCCLHSAGWGCSFCEDTRGRNQIRKYDDRELMRPLGINWQVGGGAQEKKVDTRGWKHLVRCSKGNNVRNLGRDYSRKNKSMERGKEQKHVSSTQDVS